MHVQLPHKLSRAHAKEKIMKTLAHARPRLAGKAEITEERWDNDTLHFAFSAQGQNISGTLEVRDKEYVIDARLPLILRMFEGKIEAMIRGEAKKMLV